MSGGFKALILVILVALGFAFGHHTATTEKNVEIGKIQLAHEKALGKAQAAKSEAEDRVATLEHDHATALGIATTTFEESRAHDKAISDRRIADLAARVTSLRVRVATNASGGSTVSSAFTAPGSSYGQATETLAPAIAGRLARRYAEYNELIDQLELCQATILIDRSPAAGMQ